YNNFSCSDEGLFITSSSDNTFEKNIVNSNSNAIELRINSHRNSFIENELRYTGRMQFVISVSDLNGTYLKNQNILNYSIFDLGSRIIIENTTHGRIDFISNINGSGFNLIGNGSSDIVFGNNSIYLNSSKSGLNSLANLTLYNLPTTFSNPAILRDGFICNSSTVPSCSNFTSLNAGNVSFNVSSWSTYSIGETPDAISPIINLIYPADATSSTTSAYNFTFNVNDSSNVTGCGLVFDGTIVGTLANVTRNIENGIYYSSISVAGHAWSINCTDAANNIGNSSTRSLTVEAAPAPPGGGDNGGGGGPQLPTCTPDCSGKSCGSDGCGGSCGSCGSGTTCSGGACVCTPNCAGKTCGDNGCGGSCGSCASGQTCSNGACICVANCTGKVCGDNGCGGSCGSCGSGVCVSGLCLTSNCTASCSGKTCGDDGCGRTCGTCSLGEICSDIGACIANVTCSMNWACRDGSCVNGLLKRTCQDLNGCINGTQITNVSCSENCTEDWECTWSSCVGGYFTPTCADKNNCGTNVNRPSKVVCTVNGSVLSLAQQALQLL
ncbi:MAG: hypothetical protein AAB368_07800, partial [bacterium]